MWWLRGCSFRTQPLQRERGSHCWKNARSRGTNGVPRHANAGVSDIRVVQPRPCCCWQPLTRYVRSVASAWSNAAAVRLEKWASKTSTAQNYPDVIKARRCVGGGRTLAADEANVRLGPRAGTFASLPTSSAGRLCKDLSRGVCMGRLARGRVSVLYPHAASIMFVKKNARRAVATQTPWPRRTGVPSVSRGRCPVGV